MPADLAPPRYLVAPSGCYEFVGTRLPKGYGKVGRGGKTYLAHRLAWLVWKGPIPAGLLVCHKCDNPPCVNPEHLFLGTVSDNTQDMIRKGRAKFDGFKHPNYRKPEPKKGARNGRAKLDDAQVLEMRGLRHLGYAALSAKFNVSEATVHRVLAGINWKHVTAP